MNYKFVILLLISIFILHPSVSTAVPSEITETKAEKLYQRGLELMQKGKYETAILYFLEAGPGKSNYPEPYYQTGICYLKLGEPEKARNNLYMAKHLVKEDKLNNNIMAALDEIAQKTKQEELVMEMEIEKGMNIAENESKIKNSFLSDSEKKELRKKLQKEYRIKKETGKPKRLETYNFSSGIVKITFKRLDFSLAKTKATDNPEGILITQVYPPLPVDEQLFVKEGDIVRKIENVPIIDLDDFSNDEKIQQSFAQFNSITIFRNGQEMELQPTRELKCYLTALFELKNNGLSEKTASYLYEIAKGASEYRNIARIYLILYQILYQTDYLYETLNNLLKLKSVAETFILSNELKKLENLTFPEVILQPLRETEKDFNVFIAGLQKFPQSPTSLDYVKFSEDIKQVTNRLEKWALYLQTLNTETINLTTLICTRIRDKKTFFEMQDEFLLNLQDYLKQIEAWQVCDTSTQLAKKIILLNDPFSSRMKTLPFFCVGDKNDILYLINQTQFQDWLGVTKNKIITDSKSLYNQEEISESSRLMQKASFEIKESPQFKTVEKIILQMKTPFVTLSLPEEIRKVNDLFKMAREEADNLKTSPFASRLESASQRKMLSSMDLLGEKLDTVYALILTVYVKTPYEKLTKISDTLYLSASECLSMINNPENHVIKSKISSPNELVLPPKVESPMPVPAREPPKIGMSNEEVQATLIPGLKKMIK